MGRPQPSQLGPRCTFQSPMKMPERTTTRKCQQCVLTIVPLLLMFSLLYPFFVFGVVMCHVGERKWDQSCAHWYFPRRLNYKECFAKTLFSLGIRKFGRDRTKQSSSQKFLPFCWGWGRSSPLSQGHNIISPAGLFHCDSSESRFPVFSVATRDLSKIGPTCRAGIGQLPRAQKEESEA